jgi:hypothetical protein
MEETTTRTRVKMNDEIYNYFKSKIENCETIEQLQIIEDFFYEYVEFDSDSWAILALGYIGFNIKNENDVYSTIIIQAFQIKYFHP